MIIEDENKLLNAVHTCDPTCSKAGCVNARLRTAHYIYKLRAALESK